MAHEVENMFSVREVPWHKLGVIVAEAPSIPDAIRLAGLDWSVKLEPLFTGRQEPVEANAIVRETDRSILGVVGTQYTPLQNIEAFNWFAPFIDSKECSLETAGSLRQGKRVFILAKLNRDDTEIVKGDSIRKYLLLSNGHDGTMAVRVTLTPIRVVCANTLAMAHSESRDNKFIRVVHSAKVVETIENVREIINTANATFEATAEQFRFLASKQVAVGDLKKYVDIVFDFRADELLTDRQRTAKNAVQDRIADLFETGRGVDLKAGTGSYWRLYNSVNEYLNYEAGQKKKSIEDTRSQRLNNLWFGSLRDQNLDALKVAVNMASAA